MLRRWTHAGSRLDPQDPPIAGGGRASAGSRWDDAYSSAPRGWLLLVGSVIVLALVWRIPVLHNRALTIADESYHSNQERVQMWRSGRQLWVAHPWLGIGPGAIKDVSAALPEASGRPPEGWGHLHNIYVNFAAERGLLGLLSYLLMIAALVLVVSLVIAF